MTSHEFVEHAGAGMQSRYYIDGGRVSEGYFHSLKTYCTRIDSVWTKCRDIDGKGNFRRVNGCIGYLD